MLTKKNILLIIFMIVLFSPFVFSVLTSNPDDSKLETIQIEKKTFKVEIADTDQKRAQGLSGRREIGSDGMLFVFDFEGRPGFWMKEMQFDLDFIWIRDNIVVDITLNVPHPPSAANLTDLPTYQPSVNVDSILEVPAGFVETHQIKIGDTIIR